MDILTFLNELNRQARSYHRRLWAGLAARFIILALTAWAAMALLDNLVHFSRLSRWGLFVFHTLLLMAIAFYWAMPLLKERLFKTPGSFARRADMLTGERDTWTNAADLALSLKENTSHPYRLAAFLQLARQCRFEDLRRAIRRIPVWPGRPISVSLTGAVVVLLWMMGPSFYLSAWRMIAPWAVVSAVPAYHFDVQPGTIRLYKNEQLTIQARYDGPDAEAVYLLTDNGTQTDALAMTPTQAGKYQIALPAVKSDFDYRLSARVADMDDWNGLIVSDTFHVHVAEPPQIQSMVVTVTPPAYSGLSVSRYTDNATRFNALAGSRMDIGLTATRPLSAARMALMNGAEMGMTTAGYNARGYFVLKKPGVVRFHLMTEDSLINPEPVAYHFDVLTDQPPYVEISAPGGDVEMQPEGILQVVARASDDYGVARLRLLYRHIATGDTGAWQNKPIAAPGGKTETQGVASLDFSTMSIAFGDEVEYYAEAWDGNTFSGPGRAESARYKVIFPSLDDLFQTFTDKEDEQTQTLDDVASRSEALKKTLEELHRDLKRKEKMDWKTQKRLEQTLKEHEELRKKMERLKRELKQNVERMQEKKLLSEEVLQKYQQLQELFRQVAPPELMEALQKLQQAMDKNDPREVKKALQAMQQEQEQFKQNVERALEIFKQIQAEQELDRMRRMAEEMKNLQENITRRARAKPKEAARLQQQQTSRLDKLNKAMEQALQNEHLQKFPESMRLLQQTRESLERENLRSRSENIRRQAEQRQGDRAEAQSRQMEKSLQSMAEQLQQSLQKMQDSHKQRVQSKMMAITRDLLKLSFEQERLRRESRKASQVDDKLRDVARKQARLQQNLQKSIGDMIALSHETFFIEPELGRQMARARKMMQQSLDDLGERRGMQASEKQGRAMTALNQSVNSMRKSLGMLSKSSGGTGFEQLMEQLKQMAGMQGNLNGQTQGLFNLQQSNKGRPIPGQDGVRRRLAAQQQALQQAMENLAGQMGNRSDVLGRMNELSDEMDKVVNDLLKNNVSRTTIQRQQKILSRMLDAQKSARQREYSKKRKAEQPKPWRLVRNKKKAAPNARLKQWREALKNSYKEGYNSAYQRMIEDYFKTLIEREEAPEQ